MVNKTKFYKTKVALAVVLSLGLAACGDSDGDEGSTSNTTANTVTEAVDNTVEQAQGKGSVQGTVLDTNGLPVMGATVSLAGKSVETDVNGYYYFTDVALPGVDGVNGEANDIDNTPYIVTITAPAGYAGATVNVQPEDIQVDSGNNGTNVGAGNVNASGEQTTWFDGFMAQATTAVLPKFAASVTGVLRDCNTGAALPAGVKIALDFTTISGTTTATDANLTWGVPVFTATTGENGVFTFSDIPTDSNFNLAVEGYSALPTGSLEATGAGFDDVTVTTTAEGIVNNLGDQNVCLITSNDGVAPYIAKVDSTISDTSSEGFVWEVLSKGVDGTQGIVLHFNEALDKDAIDTDDIIVTSQVKFASVAAGEKVETIASAVVADDGLSMTITLATALPEMTKFSVWMPRYQYQDTSENRIVTGDAAANEQDPDGLNNNLVVDSNTSVASSVVLNSAAANADLTFTARTPGVSGNTVTVTTVVAGVNTPLSVTTVGSNITINLATDGGGLATSTANNVAAAIATTLSATSLVNVAVEGSGAGLVDGIAATPLAGGVGASTSTGSSELGASSDTINSTQFKTEYVRTRLCTYIAPITDPGSIEGEQLVKKVVAANDDIEAVGSFWGNGGSGAGVISNLNGQHSQTEQLLQELWNRKYPTAASNAAIVADRVFIDDNTAVITGDLNDAANVISSAGVSSVSTSTGTWSVAVPNAKHKQKVTITPVAAFNIIGTPITVTLEDKVAPTTVIQDSYNYADTFGADYVNSVAGDAGYGNGGELSDIGTAGTEGSPILYVTPRLFANDEANDDDALFNNRFDVFKSITDNNTLNSATTPAPYVTSTTNFIYDVNAFAAWSGISADIGVAFSENINLVTGTSVGVELPNGTMSTTLTGFVANNSKRNEDYFAANADRDGYHTYLTHGLVQMTSNDVVGLANLDHNAVIDYSGAVKDTVNANVALTGDDYKDALVVIADAIPPFVTKAELDATQFVVTFNEPVLTTGAGSVVVRDPAGGGVDVTLNVTAATANADNTVLTWTGAGLPSRSAFRNSTVALGAQVVDIDGVANFNGVGAETESYSGTFGFAETATGPVLGHAILSWGSVEDARGNAWNDYHNLYSDSVTVVGGSTANNGIIDSQEDGDASTNGFRLAIPDLPMFLATDTIVPFGVTVAFGALDEDGTPGIDANFTITITATNPISLTNAAAAFAFAGSTAANVALEDGWRALDNSPTNVADGWNLSEINSQFRLVDSAGLQTYMNTTDPDAGGPLLAGAADTVATGNNDGQVSPEEYANYAGLAALATAYAANDIPFTTGTGASFNADNTVLTINAVIDNVTYPITQGSGVEFVKVTPTTVNITGQSGALTVVGNGVTPAGDDVDIRFGHIEGTILGTSDEEQSGNVKREL